MKCAFFFVSSAKAQLAKWRCSLVFDFVVWSKGYIKKIVASLPLPPLPISVLICFCEIIPSTKLLRAWATFGALKQ